jgi:hypothetical protein
MSDPAFPPFQPTLIGKRIELQPLQQEHASSLVDAAADGQLSNLKVTVVPGAETVPGLHRHRITRAIGRNRNAFCDRQA